MPIDAAILQEVGDRVARIRSRCADAAARAGRDADDVTIVGAAKRQGVERLAAAVLHGVHDLGQNYVQETASVAPELEALLRTEAADDSMRRVRWRLIGHLQRNKAAAAAALFDRFDALDSARLANALDRRAAEAGKTFDACIQVNLSGETQKAGVDLAALPDLLAHCAPLENLRIVGLMTLPAPVDDPEASRPTFARLRGARDALRVERGGGDLRELSMGMSGDFEIAIEEGATLVRVGTALFGSRAPKTE